MPEVTAQTRLPLRELNLDPDPAARGGNCPRADPLDRSHLFDSSNELGD